MTHRTRPTLAMAAMAVSLFATAGHAADRPATYNRAALQATLIGDAVDPRQQAAQVGREIASRALVGLSGTMSAVPTTQVRVAAVGRDQDERS